jgi:hypothetical protein
MENVQRDQPRAGRPRGNRAMNFVMAARISGEVSEAEVRRALDRVRPRHAWLMPGGPQAAQYALRVRAGCGADDWQEQVKRELRDTAWPEKGPYARFTLLQRDGGADLLGAFHHLVCDGMSGVYFMRDVLRLLDDPALDLPPLPPPPDSMDLIPQEIVDSPRMQRMLEAEIARLQRVSLRRRMSRFFRLAPAPAVTVRPSGPVDGLPPEERYCLLIHTFSADESAAISARCRAEKVSLHAAACAAWLRAYAEWLPGRRQWTRSVSSPVSLRERLSQPVPETAGQFFSAVELKLDCHPRRPFWELARAFKRDLDEAMQGGIFLFPLLMRAVHSRFAGPQGGALMSAFFGESRYDFSITNVGRLDFGLKGQRIQVEAFYNLVNASEHEKTVGINSFNGRLSFIFMFRESRLSPAQGKDLLEKAVEMLKMSVEN